MFAKELMVRADSPDMIYRLVRMLAIANINMRAVNLSECRGRRVVHLVPDNPAEAARLCDEQGYEYETYLVLSLEVGDFPGGLAGLLDVFEEESVAIEYLYTSIALPGDGAVVLIRPTDLTQAQQMVEKRGLRYLNRL